MSDLSESGSSGLSDWALVNSQGELEGSDADSNTSSIEVVEQEAEDEVELGHSNPVSRDTSPECIELEQLMKVADASAATGESREPRVSEQAWPRVSGQTQPRVSDVGESRLSQSAGDGPAPHLSEYSCDEVNVTSSCDDLEQPPQKMLGACCTQLLESAERRQSLGEGEAIRGQEVTKELQLSQGSDSPISDESLLSLSGLSSSSNASKSSHKDSDSESDFVRLEKDSSSGNTESEGEEPLSGARVSTMTTSGSSVGSEFRFFTGTGAPVLPPASPRAVSLPPQLQQPQVLPPQPPPPPQAQQAPAQQGLPPPQEHEAPLPQNPQEEEQAPPPPEEEEERPLPPAPALQQQYHQLAAAMMNDADDGDTESSTEEQDQDDRIESEQSDDAVQAEDNLDQGDLSLVNDIGDLPVERGTAARHYVHCNNQQLNSRLNRVMLAVLVLALGIGLGHWIGSAREHFSQMEIQLLQMKRLHQMQDEYLQCLSRNDKLLIEYDQVLERERDRHQEAMADLRDNNRELGEQLQEAQDELERLLAARAKEQQSLRQRRVAEPTLQDLQSALTLARLVETPDEKFYAEHHEREFSAESWQLLLQAREDFASGEAKRNSQYWSRLQQEAAKEEQLRLLLQEARQQLNNLKNENAELKLSVGKMRYNVDSLVGEPVAPPPPLAETEKRASGLDEGPVPPPPDPLPPPPLAETVEQASEKKDSASAGEDMNWEEPAASVSGLGDRHVDLDYDDLEEAEQDVFEERQGFLGDQDVATTAPGKTECNKEVPQPVPIDIALLQRNLTQERQRADMWQRLYLSERAENKQPLNSSTCLHLLAQRMNLSALMDYVLHWNLTGAGGGADFTDPTYLLSSVAKLQDRLVQALPSLWDELSSTLRSLRSHSVASSGDEGSSKDGEAEVADEDERGEEPGAESDGEGEERKGNWSDGVKKLLNKTRGTLSNVSRQLQQTWGQVKDASRHLWLDNDSLIRRVATRVKDGVSNLSRKVKRKAARWFRRHSKGEKHGHKKGSAERFQEEADAAQRAKRGDKRGEAWRDSDRGSKQASKKKQKKDGKNFHRHTDQGEETQFQTREGQTGWRLGKHRHEDLPGKDGKNDKHHHKEKHGKFGKDERNDKHHHKEKHGKFGKDERNDKHHHKEKHGKFGKDERNDKHHHKEKLGMFGKDKRNDKHHHKEKHAKGGKEERFDKHHGVKHDREERFDKQQHQDSSGEGTQFRTRAKDHSSHTDKAAAKAKFKVERKFQKLFSRMGSMDRQAFMEMDREDISEMFEDVHKVSLQYGDGSEMGLPSSGHHWLNCQFFWWVKAQPQRMLYLPMDGCLQYLAPWQLGFVHELKQKLETGECHRVKKFSCIDPEPEDEEDYYKYVCFGDADYERGAGGESDDDDDDDRYEESHQPNLSTRGQMEDKNEDRKDVTEEEMPNTKSSREDSERSARVNHTAESSLAFQFLWMKGRDHLRNEEHKADWLFDRALDREESRHQERSADWIFERAANRDASRESETFERVHSHWKESDDRQQERRKSWRRNGERGGKERGGHNKHRGKDYRQKYGRVFNCDW